MSSDNTDLFELPMSEAGNNAFRRFSPDPAVQTQKYVISSRTVFSGKNRTQILLVLSGRGKMTVNGTDYPIRQGILSVLGREDTLICLPDAPMIVYGCSYSDKLLEGRKEETGSLPRFLQRAGSDLLYYRIPRSKSDLFREIFNRMLNEAENPSRSFRDIMYLYLQEFFIRLYDLRYPEPELPDSIPEDDEQIVKIVKNYIEDNYRMKHTYDSLSRVACTSRAKLFTIFKEITGQTMGEYVVEVRIRQACTMIAETDRNIYDIMLDVGYNDMKRFCKRFRESTGMTPSEYRKQYR